jgi:hypothetical protein
MDWKSIACIPVYRELAICRGRFCRRARLIPSGGFEPAQASGSEFMVDTFRYRFGHPGGMDWKSIACIPVYRELAIF